MKSFAFSLESVLAYKHQRERMAEMLEMKVRAVVEAARRRVEEVQEQLKRLADRMVQAPVPPDSWPARFEQSNRLGDSLRAAQLEMEKAELALREATRERVRWSTEVESLKILREQQLEEFLREQERVEQVELDELGMRRWSQPRPNVDDVK
jgi:flagellar export protein FliJ